MKNYLRLRTFMLCICLLMAMCLHQENAYAQSSQEQRKVTGIVKDDNGEPIIGATVREKGSANGTVTDLDGHFVLTVKSGSPIQVSSVGYRTSVLPSNKDGNYTITLSTDTKLLNDVVVVGFGTQKKVNLTGSVATISSKEIASRPVANAAQALQGIAPGLIISQNNGQLENSPSINVRGTTTIGDGSSGSPLILIDGMQGDINSLNPNDIENISVLKDAAASSIYGSRAPFGVILVTTKSGKAGKVTLNYNNNLRIYSPVQRPHMADSYSFATYINDACDNAHITHIFSDATIQRIQDYISGKITTETVASSQGYWQTYQYGNANNDWYDILFKKHGFAQEHNASLRGGNEQLNYFFSGNFMDQKGLLNVGTDTEKRYTVTAKIHSVINKWAQFNYSMRYTKMNFTQPSSISTNTWNFYEDFARNMWPTQPLYAPDGSIVNSWYLQLRDSGRDEKETDNVYHQFGLILEPVKNWVTHLEYNYRVSNNLRHVDKKVYYATMADGTTYAANKESYVREAEEKYKYFNFNAYSDYTFNIDKNNFKMMIGFQAEREKYRTFGATRNGLMNSDLPVLDLTSGNNYDGTAVTPSINGSTTTWSTAGFFGRINYDYDGKYLTEFNVRRDGSSRFLDDQRWKTFGSFSLGWNVAKENFWKDIRKYVNTFKFRFSYGELGNQNTTGLYPSYRVMGYSTNSGTWLQNGKKTNIATVPSLISSSLTWEKVRTINYGLDWGAFNNRLTGSFDAYIRKTLDMVGPAPEMPLVLGLSVPKTNNTDLKTYGWEFLIQWNDHLSNGLNYGAKFTLSDAKSKILRYPNATGTLSSYYDGMMVGEIWGYTTKGIAKTDDEMTTYLATLNKGGQTALGTDWKAGDIMYVDVNGDGKIDNGSNTLSDHGDLTVIGNTTPRYLYSIDLNASYKGFDLRVFFQGVGKRDIAFGNWFGGYPFWGTTGSMWYTTCYTEHLDYFRAEDTKSALGANTDAYYPRPIMNWNSSSKNRQIQTRYLQDASYIRLKNFQIGYTLPNKLTQRMHLSDVRIYISGENLWTHSKMAKMFDPETVDGGAEGNSYPLTKTWSFGISLNL